MNTNKSNFELRIFWQITFLFIISLTPLHAQFFNALGVTAGVAYGNQRWTDKNLDTQERKKYILGFNGSVMAEFFSHDYLRWVSEFQFNQKGSKESTDVADYRTKLNYLCFNNYLKLRYEMVSIIPYILLGPRLEYTLSGGSNEPRVIGNFSPLHISFAVGAGLELVAYGPFKIFAEAFYDPDITNAYNQNGLAIKNYPFELRIGVKKVFGKSSKDMDCNSPVYIPNY